MFRKQQGVSETDMYRQAMSSQTCLHDSSRGGWALHKGRMNLCNNDVVSWRILPMQLYLTLSIPDINLPFRLQLNETYLAGWFGMLYSRQEQDASMRVQAHSGECPRVV